MPTVAEEGDLSLVVHSRDHGPPHVHVCIGGRDTCRIRLLSGIFMEEPPVGRRRDVLDFYHRHLRSCLDMWERYHG